MKTTILLLTVLFISSNAQAFSKPAKQISRDPNAAFEAGSATISSVRHQENHELDCEDQSNSDLSAYTNPAAKQREVAPAYGTN